VRRRTCLAGLGMALAAAALAAMPGCDRVDRWLHPGICPLCGRPIHPAMAAEVQFANEAPERVCCLRCALTYAAQTGKSVKVRSVTDHASGRPLDPKDAFYVVGSDVAPCAAPPVEASESRREVEMQHFDRCRPSVVAFASAADAERFRAQAGGEIQRLDELLPAPAGKTRGDGAEHAAPGARAG
jgi:nitrous oxide reductase accessory protein NosL